MADGHRGVRHIVEMAFAQTSPQKLYSLLIIVNHFLSLFRIQLICHAIHGLSAWLTSSFNRLGLFWRSNVKPLTNIFWILNTLKEVAWRLFFLREKFLLKLIKAHFTHSKMTKNHINIFIWNWWIILSNKSLEAFKIKDALFWLNHTSKGFRWLHRL